MSQEFSTVHRSSTGIRANLFRGLCERLAAESAKGNLREIHYERLEKLIEQMEWASRKRDFEMFRKADLAFHAIIWQANEKTCLRRIADIVTIPYHSFLLALLHRGTIKQLRRMTQIHREHLRDLRKPGRGHLKQRVKRHYFHVCAIFLALYKSRME